MGSCRLAKLGPTLGYTDMTCVQCLFHMGVDKKARPT